MKPSLLLLALFFMAGGYAADKPGEQIENLKTAMAYGTIQELNNINQDLEKDLLVRLYQVPVHGATCFIETHGICQYNYYLSVSTFDEIPQVNVFKLTMVGEVTDIQWLQEEKYDYVEIEFTINKYTKEAIANNQDLVNTQEKVVVKLDPDQVEEVIK